MAGDGMSAVDRHITNLESDAKIAEGVVRADSDLAKALESGDEREIAMAKATKIHADMRAEYHINTHALLRNEYGDIEIGEPRATKFKGAAAIKANGIVGIYRVR